MTEGAFEGPASNWWLAQDGVWYPPHRHPGWGPGDAAPPGVWLASNGRYYPANIDAESLGIPRAESSDTSADDDPAASVEPGRQSGTVVNWRGRYGFIRPVIGDNIFFHISNLEAGADQGPPPQNVPAGSRVEFDIGSRDGKPIALNVTILEFAAPETASPPDAESAPTQRPVRRADKPSGIALYDFAAMPRGDEFLVQLADMAEHENWTYRRSPSDRRFPILESYLRWTFARLLTENKVSYAQQGKHAAFNTGLVTPNQEDILAFFDKVRREDSRRPYVFKEFKVASDPELMRSFGGNLPEMAEYFSNPAELLYDRRCELVINLDHIIDENIERFPESVRENKHLARALLQSAEANTRKRVKRNYKTAIPQFYQDRLQLLLPLCLLQANVADLALVVSKIKPEQGPAVYRGNTVLTLDMAYNNARLLTKPDTDWLDP